MSMFWGMSQTGVWDATQRGVNLLDTGAHFYDAYECADGTYISLGSIEPQFYAELLRLTGLSDDPQFAKQMDKSQWPELKARLAEVFKGKTRAEWCELMEHTDVCFAPVLTMAEAAEHPHNVARQMIVERDGLKQPAPAPRFSRTVPEITRSPQHAGQGTVEALADWGIAKDRIDKLVEDGAVVAS
jgi:alpha-methylacyl-CoA racemase